jgi:hypothetical protein
VTSKEAENLIGDATDDLQVIELHLRLPVFERAVRAPALSTFFTAEEALKFEQWGRVRAAIATLRGGENA